jgi:hypothetical protein
MGDVRHECPQPKICRKVITHPVVDEYMRFVERYRPTGIRPKVTQPWMAFAERLITMNVLLHGKSGGITLHPSLIGNGDAYLWAANQLAKAQTYLWTDKVINMLRASPRHPPATLSRPLLPYPNVFFCLESAYGVDGIGNTDFHLLTEMDEGICSTTVNVKKMADPDAGAELMLMLTPWGRKFPTEGAAPEVNGFLDFLLRLSAFLRSQYIVTSPVKLPRSMLRRAEGEPELHQQRIHVVTLRHPHCDDAKGDGEDMRKHWKHRWWVSGHYREQFYPSTQRNEWIWIAPHVKGPADRPFLEKVYSVTR